MTTTRYFEWAKTASRLDYAWAKESSALFKDQLTDSCPMAAQHKESETK